MASKQNGSTTKDGLVFGFDTGDIYNSYLGRPTNNAGYNETLYNYNNVGGSVTTALTQTSETYRGAPIWKQTLTPLDSSGVSWLSNANNPGLGVVLYGGASGGGLANRYTGHSIFFKPTVPMASVPIFLHYSNIGGWQSCCDQPEDMGDGWFRARVLWYDTTTRSDGKYWAINPLSASLNVPITIYWAGPFKEDLNSTTLSQYVYGTRSVTQGLKDLTGNHSLDLTNVTFNTNTNPQIYFDGTNDYINIPSSSAFDTQTVTVEVVVKPYASTQYGFWFEKGLVNTQYSLFMEGGNIVWRTCSAPGVYDSMYFGSSLLTANQWHHVVGTYVPGTKRVYHNGALKNSNSYSSPLTTNQGNQFIGSFNSGAYYYNGEIAIVKVYNRVLSSEEIYKNYLHYKTRFGVADIGSNGLGTSSTSAATSAQLLYDMGYRTDDVYWLKPTSGATPFQAYIDFNSVGAPWVHVGSIVDNDESSNNSSNHPWGYPLNPTQSTGIWEDSSTLNTGSGPTFTSDYKNLGWSTIPFSQIMIKDEGDSKRNLLYTNEGEIKSNNSSLATWFGSLKWGALGSDGSSSAYGANRVRAVNITNFGVNDPVLQSSSKSKLLFKYGEADGQQDGNKDRSMISWHRYNAGDGVDGPTGLGCFTNRGGTIDYRDIVPGASYPSNQDYPPASIGGTYAYSIWIK